MPHLLPKLLSGMLLLLNLLVAAMNAQEPEFQLDPNDPVLKLFEPRQFSDETGATLDYRLMKPTPFDPEQKYPLVIFLHGAGERGSNNLAQLKHGAREFATDENRSKYPAYVLAPQCPQGKKWVEVDWSSPHNDMPEDPGVAMNLLKRLIDEMIETASIDRSRVYITGLSMGGYGTWDALARYPGLFAAAAPVCGGGDPKTVSTFSKVPLWSFHGTQDTVVRPERSREMIDALKAIGSTPRYTEYPNLAHDSWTETYKNPEFMAWMFEQKKIDTPR